MIEEKDVMMGDIVRFLGRPPEALWRRWEARANFADEATWLGSVDEEYAFERLLS